jgi:hypothetical protein
MKTICDDNSTCSSVTNHFLRILILFATGKLLVTSHACGNKNNGCGGEMSTGERSMDKKSTTT